MFIRSDSNVSILKRERGAPKDGDGVSQEAVEIISDVKLAKVSSCQRKSIHLYFTSEAQFYGKVHICDNVRY